MNRREELLAEKERIEKELKDIDFIEFDMEMQVYVGKCYIITSEVRRRSFFKDDTSFQQTIYLRIKEVTHGKFIAQQFFESNPNLYVVAARAQYDSIPEGAEEISLEVYEGNRNRILATIEESLTFTVPQGGT